MTVEVPNAVVAIEEPRQLPTSRGRSGKRSRSAGGVTLRPAGKRDARPFQLEYSSI